MWILDIVKENWASLVAAPWAFVTLVCIALGLGFTVARFLGAEKVSNLESRLAARDDTIADYKQKLAGATPDEARQKISDLERRLAALEPHSLSDNQIGTLIQQLRVLRGSVSLLQDMGGQRSQRFARQIEAAFSQSGWQVRSGQVMGISNRPRTGVLITSHSGEQPTPEANLIIKAFTACGIKYDQSQEPVRPKHPHHPGMPQIPEEPATEILITDDLA